MNYVLSIMFLATLNASSMAACSDDSQLSSFRRSGQSLALNSQVQCLGDSLRAQMVIRKPLYSVWS